MCFIVCLTMCFTVCVTMCFTTCLTVCLTMCLTVCLTVQVIQLVEKPRSPPLQFVFADSPGQIEIFTWSASGQLVTGERGATVDGHTQQMHVCHICCKVAYSNGNDLPQFNIAPLWFV
jgi:hypothetical protein